MEAERRTINVVFKGTAQNKNTGVQGRMISLDIFFRIFKIIIFCCVVAI